MRFIYCKICAHLWITTTNHAVHEFSVQIEELWRKAFSREHITVKSNIMKKLDKHLSVYQSQVVKKKGNKKTNLKAWQLKHKYLFDLLKSTSDPEQFDKDEKQFYFDLKAGSRRMAISDQVDKEYEEKKAEKANEEMTLISSDEDEKISEQSESNNFNNPGLMQSKLRAGKVQMSRCLVEAATQAEDQKQELIFRDTTPIRIKRNFRPDVKSAIATS